MKKLKKEKSYKPQAPSSKLQAALTAGLGSCRMSYERKNYEKNNV